MFKNTNSKKMTFILLALVLVTSLFIGGSIARYITSTSSEDEARVAIWGINEGGTNMDLFNNVYEMPDGTIIAESNGGANDKIIAPGTSNNSEFKILTASSVRPEVMYEVSINLDDSEMPDEIKNHPGIQWKLDNGNYGTWEELKLSLYNLVGNDTGVAVFGPGEVHNELANGVIHKIYWQWLLDSGYDEEDTRLGNLATSGTPITAKVVVEMTAQQVDVDATGMLEGNGSIYNTNDPHVLTFRADADYETFDSVEINGTTLNPNNYTTEEGSIIVKLKKEYLETLPIGDHKITINTTDGKEINSKFTTTNSTTIVHNGIIPEGGTYYVGVTNSDTNNYNGFTAKYESGNTFPKPQTGDVYVYGDYEYRYNYHYQYYLWGEDISLNGWGVRYIGVTTTPKHILTTINNKNIVDLTTTFAGASNIITAPSIPETVLFLHTTFGDCSNLKTPPIIPKNVINMSYIFDGCKKLDSTIIINSNKIPEDTALGIGVPITWIDGSISEDLKQAIAESSGITLVHPDVHNGIIPEGGTYYVGVANTTVNNYSGFSAKYQSGDSFPTPQTGNVYVYGDYEYRYNMSHDVNKWLTNETQNGWGVRVLDTSKTQYGHILTTIANKNVVSLQKTFQSCSNLTKVPNIPETIVNMAYTFNTTNITYLPKLPDTITTIEGICSNCYNLTTVNTIPKNVTNMSYAFAYSPNLRGTIEINTNTTNHSGMFEENYSPILITGSSNQLNNIATQYPNVSVK